MIICDVCARDGVHAAPGKRHVFPVRRIDDNGPHEVSDVFSVDLCDNHAREFWENFRDLIDSYSRPRETIPSGQTAPIPSPLATEQGPPKDWRPEAGKWYGKPGVALAYVDMIDKKGNVRFRDDASNVGSITPAEFAKFYGMTPVKKG